MTHCVRLLCVTFLGLLAARHGTARAVNTYYVSSGVGPGAQQAGDDANPGTPARPFRTLTKAVRALRSGDTLVLRGGEYDTVNGLSDNPGNSLIPSGTSWAGPTTLQAFTREKPVLRRYMPVGTKVDELTYRDSWHMPTLKEALAAKCAQDYPYSAWSGGPTGGGLQEQSAYSGQGPEDYVLRMWNDAPNPVQYIVIDGVDIDARGICNTLTFAAGARHIRFQNLEIRNSIRSGITQLGIRDSSLETDLQFFRCKIHSCGVPYDTNRIKGVLARKHPQARFRHPWYMHAGGNSIIESETYNCAGTGLSPAGNNNVIAGNFIHDNSVHGLYVSGGKGWDIRNNVFYNNGGTEIIVMGGGNHKISNNTIVAGPPENSGRATYGILLNPTSVGSVIENNIIYRLRRGIVDNSEAKQPPTIRHNLIFCGEHPGSEFSDQHARTRAILEKNIFGADPLFVNPAALDFRLRKSSPAIGKGYNNGLESDRLGVVRPRGAGIDIGAYQFTAN